MDRPKTLVEKVWEKHVVRSAEGEPDLIYVDLHLVHEVTSPQAFEGLRLAGRGVRRPDLTLATMDHNVPTSEFGMPIEDKVSAKQMEALKNNCEEFGIKLNEWGSIGQGIVHIIGPETGLTQPGLVIVCGDSHTATHGAFGALAFGIGTSEVEHVLATQTLHSEPAEDHGRHRRGRASCRRHGQGPHARHPEPHRDGRRGRARHRVQGRGRQAALHGGPHDRVQHVHRGRGQGRPRRAGRDDLRVPRRQRVRSQGRALGSGGRGVEEALDRRGRRVRQGGRDPG